MSKSEVFTIFEDADKITGKWAADYDHDFFNTGFD